MIDKKDVSAPSANRPFPLCLKLLFQSEDKCEAINTTMIFILMQIKFILTKKVFAFSLVLKVGVFETRKRRLVTLLPPAPCVMTDETRTAAEKT